MISYTALKHFHLATVAITIGLFSFRAILHFLNHPLRQKTLLKILPHVNDTLLLISGISLIVSTELYPTEHTWVLAKLIAVLVYIGLGVIFFKRCQSLPSKLVGIAASFACLAYIALVAITKSAIPF
ncbi:MAG: SirB2 family protein [Methylococcales bacterium]|jgi:uncharacterized membrane protein SirB2|nr:SirB2 family protein [Methylococcales bacterium]MBT7445895.1 SirB2 family protein [Methylococcales bacterium]